MFKRVRNTNAYVECKDKVVRLMSYNTLVCEVHTDYRHVLLSPAARCSRTTIRHLSEFLSYFKISYFEVKPCLMDPSHETVATPSGFTVYVSDDPRFRFHATQPFCLL